VRTASSLSIVSLRLRRMRCGQDIPNTVFVPHVADVVKGNLDSDVSLSVDVNI